MFEININPSRRDLRVFALLLAVFAAVLGYLALYKPHSFVVAAIVLTVAVVISLLFNSQMPRGQQLLGFLLPVLMGSVGGSIEGGTWGWVVVTVLWIVAAVVGGLIWISPPFGRIVYMGWMMAAIPIGWTLSHVILAVVYYLTVTPVGLIMRLTGHDPLHRKLDRTAKSYWVPHDSPKESSRYFRQF